MDRKVDIAILGASGLYAGAVLEALSERGIPGRQLQLLDHDSALGADLAYGNGELPVHPAAGFDFSTVRAVFVDAAWPDQDPAVAQARAAGCTVVQAGALPHAASLAVKRLLPVLAGYVPRALRLSVLSSASAAGRGGVEELAHQTRQLLGFTSPTVVVFPSQIAFNVVPEADLDSSQRIVADLAEVLPAAAIDVDLLWVPMFYGQGVSFQFEAAAPLSLHELRGRLQDCAGVELHPAGDVLTPVSDASGNDQVHAGNLALAGPGGNTLKLWLVFDNLRLSAVEALAPERGLLP